MLAHLRGGYSSKSPVVQWSPMIDREKCSSQQFRHGLPYLWHERGWRASHGRERNPHLQCPGLDLEHCWRVELLGFTIHAGGDRAVRIDLESRAGPGAEVRGGVQQAQCCTSKHVRDPGRAAQFDGDDPQLPGVEPGPPARA